MIIAMLQKPTFTSERFSNTHLHLNSVHSNYFKFHIFSDPPLCLFLFKVFLKIHWKGPYTHIQIAGLMLFIVWPLVSLELSSRNFWACPIRRITKTAMVPKLKENGGRSRWCICWTLRQLFVKLIRDKPDHPGYVATAFGGQWAQGGVWKHINFEVLNCN